MSITCLTDAELHDFLADRLSDVDASAFTAHLSECDECSERCSRLCETPAVRRAFQLSDAGANEQPSNLQALKALQQRLYGLINNEHTAAQQFSAEAAAAEISASENESCLSQRANENAGKVMVTRIAHFQVLTLLGTGGFANVYLARDQNTDRRVAIKIPIGAARTSLRDRSQQLEEARVAAKLNHPNIVKLLEVGEHAGVVYLASEYCDGPTLAEWMDSQQGCVEHRTAALIIQRLAASLQHAHLNGLIHRDVKPANILLDSDQPDDELPFTPKLTDFGLAKQVNSVGTETAPGIVKGTPRYMAPEQAMNADDQLQPACDIYSLGVILYELLCGEVPIKGSTPVDTLRRLVSEIPQPVQRRCVTISSDLAAITMKCLEKQPEHRYDSAQSLASDLERFLQGLPTRARPLNPLQQFGRWANRNKLLAGVSVLAVLALGVATAVLAFSNSRLQHLNRQLAASTRQKAELLYEADMRLASQAVIEGDLLQVQQLLERHAPKSGEPDLRGLEWSLLRQADVADPVMLTGHVGDVYAVRYSSNGKLIASAGMDGTVRIYQASRLRDPMVIVVGTAEVNGVAFSPDSLRIAVASDDGSVALFELQNGHRIRTIPAHNDKAFQVEFAPDGHSLFSCGNDPFLKQWDSETGELLKTVGTHEHMLENFALSADGRLAACACKEGSYVWDVLSGELLANRDNSFRPTSADILNNGLVLWGTRHRRGILDRLLESSDFKEMPTEINHLDPLQSVALAPNAGWAASGDKSGVVSLWPLTGVAENDVPQPSNTNVATQTLNVSITPHTWKGHDGRVWWIEISPDTKEVATAGADGVVCIWPIPGQKSSGIIRDRKLEAKKYSRVQPLWGNSFVLVSEGHVSLLDLSRPEPEQIVAIDYPGRFAEPTAVSHVGDASMPLLIFGDGSGAIQLLDVRSGAVAAQWADTQQRNVLWMQTSPDESRLFVLLDGSLLTFKLPELIQMQGFESEWCNAVALDPTGHWLAIGNRGVDTIDLWDLHVSQKVRTLDGHNATIRALEFSPDGLQLASASLDRSIRLWDVSSGQMTAWLTGHRAPVCSLAYSPDGHRLLSAAANNQTIVWALPSGGQLLTIGEPHVYEGPQSVSQLIQNRHWNNKSVLSNDGRFLVRLIEDVVAIHEIRPPE